MDTMTLYVSREVPKRDLRGDVGGSLANEGGIGIGIGAVEAGPLLEVFFSEELADLGHELMVSHGLVGRVGLNGFEDGVCESTVSFGSLAHVRRYLLTLAPTHKDTHTMTSFVPTILILTSICIILTSICMILTRFLFKTLALSL
mgnify:CR=1 FL=1